MTPEQIMKDASMADTDKLELLFSEINELRMQIILLKMKG